MQSVKIVVKTTKWRGQILGVEEGRIKPEKGLYMALRAGREVLKAFQLVVALGASLGTSLAEAPIKIRPS